jgi:predicted dehydrogenase
MMKVGIIGCGKQADAHADLIERIPACEIVGVCDQEELMAKQLYERYNVRNYYKDLNDFLNKEKPEIIHVTTPPHSHLEIGKRCLEAGCHIYFEKPFTLNTLEAKELIDLATEKNLKLTVGHNNQFSHIARHMRKLVKDNFLGGDPVHMESIWGYDLGDQRFAKALLGDTSHWIRTLPGKLLHNIINHGISKIAEFVSHDQPKVIVHGFTSPILKEINETEIIDELRVTIYDHNNTSAYFTFSTQISPMIRQFRIYGLKNSLILDDMHQTLVKVVKTDYKSFLNNFIPPVMYSKQYLRID